MSTLGWLSWGAWALVLGAALFRSRAYAIFRGVVLAIHTLIAVPLLPHFGALLPLALGLHSAVYIESIALVWPRLRPWWYRALISWPGMYFAASIFMAFPWAILVALGAQPWALFLPFLLGALGMVQSLTARPELRDLVIGQVTPSNGVVPLRRPAALGADTDLLSQLRRHQDPLRIAQITDPHLGPFMSVQRLKAISQRLAAQEPDLVVLTGDFLTMESQGDEAYLTEALLPLAKLEGKVFACLGNHDHEAPKTVRNALQTIGARLLIDEAVTVQTRLGNVQIVGFDFHFTHRETRMKEVCKRFPRESGALRLMLLHDPGAFKHLAPGDADLVLSGHTHGGQVGLVSLGLEGTVAWWVAKMPDHGLWGNGTNRLYVHRGTGHYGFPLRLGVPAEESVLSVYIAGQTPSAEICG